MGVGMPSMGSGSGFGSQGGRDIEGMEEGMQHEQGSGYGGEDGHADLVRFSRAPHPFEPELMYLASGVYSHQKVNSLKLLEELLDPCRNLMFDERVSFRSILLY